MVVCVYVLTDIIAVLFTVKTACHRLQPWSHFHSICLQWWIHKTDINLSVYVDHLHGSDGMVSSLVLGCADVEHAIWRHRGSVPPSGEMNGHQHNPLSAHVSRSQQKHLFYKLVCGGNVFRILLSDPRRGYGWLTLFILLPLPPGELPGSPVANHGWGWSDVFELQSSRAANWQAEWPGGQYAPVLPPRIAWMGDDKCIYVCV